MRLLRKSHWTFAFDYDFVCVTKCDKSVLDAEALDLPRPVVDDMARRWSAHVQEFNGETSHVHLHISWPPSVSPSAIAKSLKSVSSRLLRKSSSCLHAACRANVFWSLS